MKKYLIAVAVLVAANAFSQTETVEQFLKDKDSLVRAVDLKWFVDSISIERKIEEHKSAVAADRIGSMADYAKTDEERYSDHIGAISEAMKEMAFYRKERNEKLRAAFRAYAKK